MTDFATATILKVHFKGFVAAYGLLISILQAKLPVLPYHQQLQLLP